VFKWIVDTASDSADLHRLACEKFNIQRPEDFILQYLDPDFKEYVNLTDVADICDLMSLRLCPKITSSRNEPIASASTIETGSAHLRRESWPKTFELPVFDSMVQMFLKSADDNFSKNGTPAVVPRDIKVKLLDAVANKIFGYTAYASKDQIQQAAKALVDKHPSLQCTTAPNGWEAWAHALGFKMGNFRMKMRRLGCEEV